jgi:N-acyl-D-aspartate/D-glutamate deacylase
MMLDLLIRDATVVDGAGAQPITADVGVEGERIAFVGQVAGDVEARRVILADGQVVCPGFIDIHTHSDLTLVEDGTGESKLLQGVTTEVVGNCSFAAFPIEPMRLDLHADHLARATASVVPWWTDLSGYAEALHQEGLAINVVPLAGHGTLRVAAMGVDQRPPTEDELARMQRDLATALDQGAFGMSTGLTHVPSAYGGFDEVAALARVLKEHGALYATHSRSSRDLERGSLGEAIDLGRETGVTVEFSHIAINNPSRWGTASVLLEQLDAARDEGIEIFFDVYPYHASSSSLTQYLPPWVQAGGTDALRARMADQAEREGALAEMAQGWFGGIPWLWDRFMISHSPDGNGVGATLADLSEETGVEPYELTIRLCEEFGNRIQVVLFYRTEEDMETFLAHPMAIVGSDGNAIPMHQPVARPHPRSFGTFPRVLGRYTRERKVLDLVDAIRKMSGEPARRLGLSDRGVIRVGAVADLVVFDPNTVMDNAEFGQPAGPPTGIGAVVVSGTVMVEDGRIAASRPGRVLRRG